MSDDAILGTFKSSVEDFVVIELLDVAFSGEGEHYWVYLRKKNLHTEDVAKALAKFARIPVRSVGYSGMKDKFATTEQWFSLQLPGKEMPNWALFELDGVEILKTAKHQKKLNRGTHKFNYFEVVFRDSLVDQVSLAKVIHQVNNLGVPNYFGAQRFGYDKANIKLLSDWIKGEIDPPLKRKKWLLSVYRSVLFNHYLDVRIKALKLNQVIKGDIVKFADSNSVYQVLSEEDVYQAQKRLMQKELYITGPLWGKEGKLTFKLEAKALIDDAFKTYQSWLDAEVFMPFNLTMDYRNLVLMPKQLKADFDLNSQTLTLKFMLPSGSFATTLIDGIVTLLKDCLEDVV